jgi:flagellar hook-basal body complex protein FliE
MSIAPVSSVPSVPVPPPVPVTTAPVANGGGSSFQSALVGAINSVQTTQATADQLNVAAVTGNLSDISQATVASTRAQVTVQLVSAVRNQAVDSFNSIMSMSA